MDTRTKDFNRYLDEVRIINALTACFARLFMFTDFDRPDHGIWFLQNCVNSGIDPDFIVNYDKLLNELAANNKFLKKGKKALDKVKQEEEREAAKATAKAKKEQNASSVQQGQPSVKPSASQTQQSANQAQQSAN